MKCRRCDSAAARSKFSAASASNPTGTAKATADAMLSRFLPRKVVELNDPMERQIGNLHATGTYTRLHGSLGEQLGPRFPEQ